jgi:hypothetical protein
MTLRPSSSCRRRAPEVEVAAHGLLEHLNATSARPASQEKAHASSPIASA